jgi:two-component system response regulator YesN
MHRMLIVDDEPYIVASLKEMFEDTDSDELDLDIYSAGSALEALERLEQTRIDIVLSDIRMPGMSGLELMGQIRRRWPACKVIFLSGHNEFSYVQEALRQGSAGYLLKTDDEEDIVATVAKAVAELASEQKMMSLVEKAKQQMHKALPLLQKSFLIGLVKGEGFGTDGEPARRRFAELELPLDAERDLMLVVGRVDQWEESFSPSDKDLLLYAIQNIAYEVLGHAAEAVSVVRDRARFFWIVQKRPESALEDLDLARFVRESLDFIQSQCSLLLKLPISLASTLHPFPWGELPGKYGHLNRLLIRGLGQGDEMLLYEEREKRTDAEQPEAGERNREANAHRRQAELNQLRTLLESGNREQFDRLLAELAEQAAGGPYEELQETYYTVATMILSQINRWAVYGEVTERLPLDQLFSLNSHVSWPAAASYLKQAAGMLFELQDKDKSDKSMEVVDRLHRYIWDHVDGDVSLARLADVAGLNASYLCRLYKQLTGIGLSDYITDAKLKTAKRLLRESDLRISEVASRVGFDSGYFSRYFKKITTLTPQEYREKVVK